MKLKEPSDFEKLESILRDLCAKHAYKLYVAGWTRKTFDVFQESPGQRTSEHLVRVESLATTNGEIQLFDERAMPFVEELGKAIEESFRVPEAVLVRGRRPEY